MSSNINLSYFAPVLMHGFSNNRIHPVLKVVVFFMLCYAMLRAPMIQFRAGKFSVSMALSLVLAPFMASVPFSIAYFIMFAIQITSFGDSILQYLYRLMHKPASLVAPAVEIELNEVVVQSLENQDTDTFEAQIQQKRSSQETRSFTNPHNCHSAASLQPHFDGTSLDDEAGNPMGVWV